MTTRIALFAYCALAAFAAAVGAALVAQAAAGLDKGRQAASDHARAAGYTASLLDHAIADLMQSQREGRLTANPDEAIAVSAELQGLQEEFDRATETARKAGAEAAELEARQRRTALFLVPLVALFILHAIGAFYFSPRRG